MRSIICVFLPWSDVCNVPLERQEIICKERKKNVSAETEVFFTAVIFAEREAY